MTVANTLGNETAGRYDWLLLSRWFAVNIFAASIVVFLWLQGWIGEVVATDASRLTLVIAATFLLGLGLSFTAALKISGDINAVGRARRGLGPTPDIVLGRTVEALRAKLEVRIAGVRHLASTLVVMGLIGTVIGFVIALSEVNPATVGDPSSIGPMVARLIQGMRIALYTTLVGAALNLWLLGVYRILAGGAAKLFAAVLEYRAATPIPSETVR